MKTQKYIAARGYEDFQRTLNELLRDGWRMVPGTENHDYRVYDLCGLFTCIVEKSDDC